jgi:predicted SnoaL-like aldol condensation-catalyzing enzyme
MSSEEPPARSEVDDTPASRLDANKQTVRAFYEAAINNKDFETASKLIGPHYIQHNPLIADGIDGLSDFVAYLAVTFPRLRAGIKRIFADEDFVIAHVHGVRVPGQPGSAIVDIFKLEHGRIVEHWDVTQAIPEQSENANGMF